MADFRKCREDAGLPLHTIAEDPAWEAQQH